MILFIKTNENSQTVFRGQFRSICFPIFKELNNQN